MPLYDPQVPEVPFFKIEIGIVAAIQIAYYLFVLFSSNRENIDKLMKRVQIGKVIVYSFIVLTLILKIIQENGVTFIDEFVLIVSALGVMSNLMELKKSYIKQNNDSPIPK